MKGPSEKQIQAEIKALEACKAYAPHYTKFGDNNHANIDLQIQYLRGEIDITSGEWDDFTDDEQSIVREAQAWDLGQSEESISSGWDSFKPKVAAVKKGK
jgi:hypothetical protein